MTQSETGGQAFPTEHLTGMVSIEKDGKIVHVKEMSGGMTLREYFAAKALGAMDLQITIEKAAATMVAQSAYRVADAMLEARK